MKEGKVCFKFFRKTVHHSFKLFSPKVCKYQIYEPLKRNGQQEEPSPKEGETVLGKVHEKLSKYLFVESFNELAKQEIHRTNLLGEESWSKQDVDRLESQVISQMEELAKNNELEDPQANGHLQMACLVLAWYRALSVSVPEQSKVLHLLKFCCREQVRSLRHLLAPLALANKVGAEPLPLLKGEIQLLSKLVLGKSFDIYIHEDRGVQMHVDVHKCFFHSFFTKHDCTFLTQVFCAADNLVEEYLDPKTHGVDYERPHTLPAGHKFCRFSFHRKTIIKSEGAIADPVLK